MEDTKPRLLMKIIYSGQNQPGGTGGSAINRRLFLSFFFYCLLYLTLAHLLFFSPSLCLAASAVTHISGIIRPFREPSSRTESRGITAR